MMLKFSGLRCRAMCSTSLNPSVVTIPTRAPLRSRIVLVPTVVPCSSSDSSDGCVPA